MRQLTLHASALNDAEYELYTTSLQDLAWTEDQAESSNSVPASGHDDAYYEQMRVSVREVRAWIRGRYAHVSLASIDNILRLFSPGMGVLDALTGGQFFVTLRLVLHVEAGNDVNRSLAFVQAHPSATSPSNRRYSSPERKPDSISLPSTQDFPASAPPTSQMFSQKRLQPYSPSFTNPFTSSNTNTDPDSQCQPLPQPSKSPTPSFRSSHAIHNPFVTGNASYLPETGPAPEPPKLPPRKPLLIPPPVHPVRSNPRHSPRRKSVSPSGRSIASPRGLPIPSPSATSPSRRSTSLSPTKSRSSTQESLEASKATREAKKHEKTQENERVLQVLKSSSVISGGYSLSRARVTGSSVVVGTSVHNRGRSHGTSPMRPDSEADGGSGAPPLSRQTSSQRQQPSPPGSVSSFEHVASPSSAAMIPRGTTPPPPPQSSLPPSSPSRRYSSSNPYHKRPLPIPGNNAIGNGLYRSPQSSPTRSFFDLPNDTDATLHNSKPAHFRYRSPSSSSSASSTFTFINHADAIPDAPSSSFTPAYPSNPLTTPTKSGFFSFHNSPAPSRSPYHNSTTPMSRIPRSPSPRAPRTPSKYPGLALSPSPYAPNNSPLPTTPQNANDTSPSARIFRSKSVHQPSPPLPPLPASTRSGGVRRKRPESVLVLSSGEVLFGVTNAHSGTGVEDGDVGMDGDAAQNHDGSETWSRGKGDHKPGGGQERHTTLPLGSSSGDERRRSSLSRSISISSASTNQTTTSQPLPDAYSHSPRSRRFAHLDQPRPVDQHPTQGPTQDSIPGQHIPDKSLSSLSNIQRTIAKFDAYAVQSKHA